ncbi:MAG: tetratricopeptide repeat protein [Bacteroidota bacterium]
MKTLTKLFLILFIAGSGLEVSAQTGAEDGSKFGSGKDSIRCLKNLSLYSEYYKQNNYEDAAEPWKIIFNECPKASKNIYLRGEKMLEDAIENTDDKEQKSKLLDSLMGLYDQRIEYYGQEGYVIGKKGTNYVKYAEKTVENLQKAYDLLEKSIELRGNNTSVSVIVTYMQTTRTLYSNDVIEGKKVLSNYATALDILEANLEKEPNSSLHERGLKACNDIFEDTDAATCDNLVELFEPRFEEKPKDEALLQRITSLLEKQKCTETDLYADAAVNLNEIEPSSESAYQLAKLFYSKDEFEKSAEFYEQAIELQGDDKVKAKYYMELAELTFDKLEDKEKARDYARESLEFNPDNGKPYILIGRMYTKSVEECGDDEFEQKTVYWAAVDKFQKAKEVDSDVADEADEYIESYRPRFPDKKTIFFQNLELGESYEIGCWINETTTIRQSE